MANYTQKAIMQTFETMLVEMPFDKITVSALVARCEISSNTFYYHYRDIYDLLDTWLQTIQERFLSDPGTVGEWPARLKTILHQMQDNSQMVYHIFNGVSRERLERYIFTSTESSFYNHIKEKAGDREVSDETLRDIAGFCCYSILGFFLKFIWMRMDIDVDSSVDRLMSVFGGMLEYAILRAEMGAGGGVLPTSFGSMPSSQPGEK